MIHNVSHVCLAIIVRFLLSFPFFLLSFVFISFSLLVFWILHVVPFKSLTMKTSNNHPKVNIKMYTTYWWSFSNSTKKNVIRWDRMLIDKSLEELRIQTCDRSVNNQSHSTNELPRNDRRFNLVEFNSCSQPMKRVGKAHCWYYEYDNNDQNRIRLSIVPTENRIDY